MIPGVFSDAQISKLQATFGGIKSFPTDKLPEMRRLLGTMSNEAVAQVMRANIRWLSPLAVNEAVRRDIMVEGRVS